MSLQTNGINWICQKLGDANNCCVKQGLVFNYIDSDGITHSGETGGTWFLTLLMASGVITSVTMTTPNRPTVTPLQMHTANGEIITMTDADEIQYHDETTDTGGVVLPVGQWCSSPAPPACTTYLTKAECETAKCYWYADIPIPYIMPETCHALPQDPMTKYLVYGGIALVGLSVLVLLFKRRG